jgi:hypothetical protein
MKKIKAKVMHWPGRDSDTLEVDARWKGSSLAVHRPVMLSGETAKSKWTITHITTMMALECRLNAPVQNVIALAQLYDQSFLAIRRVSDCQDHVDLVRKWKRDVAYLLNKQALVGP